MCVGGRGLPGRNRGRPGPHLPIVSVPIVDVDTNGWQTCGIMTMTLLSYT